MSEKRTSPMRKRILSLVLALVMLLSTVPVSALASEEDVLDGIRVTNIVVDPTEVKREDGGMRSVWITADVVVEDGIVFDPETPFTFYFTQISNVEGEADTSSTDLCSVEGEEGNWTLSAECWINSRWNIATYALSDVKYGEESVAFDGEHELTITPSEENSPAVPEEPVATDAFRINSIGWRESYMDAVAQNYYISFSVTPASTTEITAAEMYIDVYDADGQPVYSGWVSAERVIADGDLGYQAIFALTDEMLAQAAYGTMNIMVLKAIDSKNRYAAAEPDEWSEYLHQVHLEDGYCEKLYVTDMTVDTDVITLTQEVREAQASVTAKVVAAEGYTITGDEELRVMWSCDSRGYGGSQMLQQDENGQWYFTSTAYIGYEWVAGDYQVEVYEVGTDRLVKNLGEPAGVQVIRDLPDNEDPVLTEISFILNGEEIKADFENSFSLPYGSKDKLQIRLYVDDASPLGEAHLQLSNDAAGVETGLSMSYDEEQMVWQADFELGTSTLEPGEWFVDYVHLWDMYRNETELYPRNAHEVFMPARFFVEDENGEVITPAYDYYGDIRYWNGVEMVSNSFDSLSGPYATTDELGLQLVQPDISGLTFQGWECEHEGIKVLLNAGDRLPGRGGWYALKATYDKVMIRVNYEYANAYGGWENGEMHLAVPVGTTYAQIADIFAEAMADVEHDANLGFAGWKLESSWMEDMNAEAGFGENFVVRAQYSRQFREMCYLYLDEMGNLQQHYVQGYFNSSDTHADIAVWAAENVPEGISHSEQYGFTGQWLAQYPDIVVGEDGSLCRVYAVYETIPLYFGYSGFDEDLNRIDETLRVELSGESTVQEVMDYFMANCADEVSHPSFLTLDHWELDSDVELTDKVNIADWIHFIPIYKQPVVTLQYEYITTTQYGNEQVTEETTLVLDEGATVADLRAAIAEMDTGLNHVDELGNHTWISHDGLGDDTVLEGVMHYAIRAEYENPHVLMNYEYYNAESHRRSGTAVIVRTEGMTVRDAFNSFAEQFGDLPHSEEMEFNGWEWEGDWLDNEAHGMIGSAVATYRKILVYVEYEDYRRFEDGRLQRDVFSQTVAVPENGTVADARAAFAAKAGTGNAADVLGACTWVWPEYPMDDEGVFSGMWMGVGCEYEKFPVYVTYRYWDADGEYRIEKASLGVSEGATHADVIDLFNARIASNVEHCDDYGEALGWAVDIYWSSDKEPTWREAEYIFDAWYEEETPEPTRVYVAIFTNYNSWNRYNRSIYEVDGQTTYGELVEAMAEEMYRHLGHYAELTFQGWTAPEGISMDDPVELFQGDLMFVADYDKIPAVVELSYVNNRYDSRYEEITVFLPEDATYQDLYDAVALPDDGAHCPELGFTGWDVDITSGAAMSDPIRKVDYDSLYCDMMISAQYDAKAIDVQLTMLNEQGEVISDGFRMGFDADMSLEEYMMTLEWPDCGHELIGWRTMAMDGGDYTGWREMVAVYADMAPLQLEVQYAGADYNDRGFREYIYLPGTYATLTEEEYLAAAEDALQSKLDQFVPDGLNVSDIVMNAANLDMAGTVNGVAYVSYSVEYDKALLHMHMPHEITVSVAVDYGTMYELPTTFNDRPIRWDGCEEEVVTVCVDQPHFGMRAYYADDQDNSCGENVWWDLYGYDGSLQIYGEGAVTSAPWLTETLKPYIKHVRVEPGVTALPAGVFDGCGNIEEIYFVGETVPELAEGCFEGLNAVVVYPCNELWTEEYRAAAGGNMEWAAEHEYDYDDICRICGERRPVELGWHVDDQGKLNVFNDAIPDFPAPEDAPWAEEAGKITEIVVGGNVPYVGENAFAICTKADKILFVGEAPEFHENAFAGFIGTVRYMPGSTTWDEVIGQQFGGKVTWEPYVGPEAPANVSVELNKAGQPVITWDPVEGVEIYVVYRQIVGHVDPDSTDVPGEYEIVFHTEGTSFTHTTAAREDTAYNYKVCSYDGEYDIFGEPSEAVSTRTFSKDWPSDMGALLSGIADNLYWWSYWMGFFEENEAPDAELVHGFLGWICDEQFAPYEVEDSEVYRAIWAAAYEEMAFAYFAESEELLNDLHSSYFYDGDGYYYSYGGVGDIMPEYYYRSCKLQGYGVYEVYGYEVQWYDGFDEDGMPITYVPGEDEVEGIHYVMCTRTYEDENGETVTETYPAKIVGTVTTQIRYANGYPQILGNTREDYAAPVEGQCGENLTWSVEDGVLTISGTGAMYDFTGGDYSTEIGPSGPWASHRDSITKIVVEEGVTRIGRSAFVACWFVESVTLPSTVKSIGGYAFADCSSLKTLVLPEGVERIDDYAFSNSELTEITFAKSVKKLGEYIFSHEYTSSLQKITFLGDAPILSWETFNARGIGNATIYTPCNNKTWTDAVKHTAGAGYGMTWAVFHADGCNCVILSITQQPEDVSVHKGETASVSVVAEGEGLTYQWYYTSNADDPMFRKSSTTTATYTTTMDESRDGRQVYCVVTDKYGATVTSEVATLTMIKPVITQQPQHKKVKLGESVSVSVAAEGEGLTYQWYYTSNADDTVFRKSSTTTATYTTTMDESRAGRQVYCVVTDKYGASVTSETVTLNLRYIDAEIFMLYMNAEDEYAEAFAYVKVPEGATYQALYDLAQFPTDHTVNLGELVEWKPGKTLTDVIAVDPEGEEPSRLQITAVYEYINLKYGVYYLDANGEVCFDAGATRIPTGSTPSEFFDRMPDDSGYEIKHWGISGMGDIYDMRVTGYACYDGMVPVRTTVEYQNAEGETDYTSEVIYIENFDSKSEEQIKAEIYAYLLEREGLCPEGTDITGYTMDEYNFIHSVNEDSHVGPNCFIFAQVQLLYGEHVHVLTKVDAKDAACKESGNIAYYTCACGKWFSDEAAENEIADKTSVIIPATGHTETILPGKDATCTEPGLTEGKVCDACGEITVKQETIPALGHSEDILPSKDATCTEPGLTEGLYCTTCGETLVEQNTIPATGHTEHIIPGKDATCTETGLTDHVTCEICGITLSEQTVIPALGHEETVLDAIDPTCTETGRTEGISCSRCGEILSGYEVVDALGHKEIDLSGKDATCTETGLTAGKKCTVCGETTVQQTVIPALGHSNVTGGVCGVCGETVVAITKQPVGVSVNKGKDASVSVVAEGEGLSYQWYFKNKQDTGFGVSATKTATYSAEMDDLRDGRQVYCVITDKYGNSVQSETVTMTMIRPEITTQPADVVAGTNKTASTKVVATGEGLTYQWYYTSNGDDTLFRKSSTTTAVYSTTMDAVKAGRQVYCVVTDKYGASTTSDVATLSLAPNPVITTQPVGVKVKGGETAVVTVVAEGEGLSYQWYYTMNGNDNEFMESSMTGTTYSTVMDENKAGRQVYCVVTNKYGHSVKTDVVALDMSSEIVITQQPQDVIAGTGKTVAATVKAEGLGLTYQWYYTMNGSNDEFMKSSNTTATYSTVMDKSKDGRRVYCVITDKFGVQVTTEEAVLSLAPNPVITTQPVGVKVKGGETAVATVVAEGEGLNYQWYYTMNGEDNEFVKSSMTGTTYSTVMDENKAGRQVYCVVTNKYGHSVKSDVVALDMSSEIVITQQPQDVIAGSGKTAAATVKAEGLGLTYQWYYTMNGSNDEFMKSSNTTATYSTVMDKSKDGRRVYCVITDKFGVQITTEEAVLSLAPNPVITTQPVGVKVKGGETAVATVVAEGEGLSYQWYYTMNGEDNEFVKSSMTGTTYSTVMDENKAGRQVYCVVTNKYGHSVKSDVVALDMSSEIVITQQPQNVIAGTGKTVAATVKAEGLGLTYQWYYTMNGESTEVLKSSMTGTTYSTVMDKSKDGRRVYCVITDKFGVQVTTEEAVLSLAPYPAITTQPVDVTVKNGETVTVTVEAEGEGLSYQWYYTSNASDTVFRKSSTTTATYSTVMDATRAGRQVYCVVTNKYGHSTKSDAVTLSMEKVEVELKITKQPVDVTVKSGETAKVTVEAEGEGLTYQWYYTSKGGQTQFFASSNKTATYTTSMDASRAGRQVYCIVTDANGNSVRTNTVTLSMEQEEVELKITKQPEGVTVKNGETAKVTVEAEGEGLTYQWYYTSKGGQTQFFASSNKTATYTTTMDASRAGRQVYCIVTDANGNTVRSNTVTLNMTESTVVYLSKTGSKYHMVEDCSGMTAVRSLTEEEALAEGKTPCSNCCN